MICLGGKGAGRAGWNLFCFCLGLCLLAAALPALAQDDGQPDEGLYIAPKVTRLFNSHTSYQFGDPWEPQLKPLSRLEFPLDSWWGGVQAGYRGKAYSASLELMTNISRDTDGGRMKDSDWENPQTPQVTTTYSESHCRLKPSLTLDGSVDYSLAPHLGLPQGLDLRPVLGLRYQRYTFVAYDGLQSSLVNGAWVPDAYMSGEAIWFRQEYVQPYLGLRAAAEFKPPRFLSQVRKVEVSLQGDWAFVYGANRDHHLLRGDRITEEHTTGQAWHGALGLRVPVGQWGILALSCDYLRIRTSGQHDWYPDPRENMAPESWDYGVDVWSDQRSLSLSLEIPFSSIF